MNLENRRVPAQPQPSQPVPHPTADIVIPGVEVVVNPVKRVVKIEVVLAAVEVRVQTV